MKHVRDAIIGFIAWLALVGILSWITWNPKPMHLYPKFRATVELRQ